MSTTPALAWVAAGKRAAYVTDVTGVDGAPLGRAGRGLVAAAAETHGLLMSMMRDR